MTEKFKTDQSFFQGYEGTDCNTTVKNYKIVQLFWNNLAIYMKVKHTPTILISLFILGSFARETRFMPIQKLVHNPS